METKMKINYDKTWDSMNSLEQTVCKVVSSREIINAAISALQEHQYDKAESLMQASYEFLEYYIADFDEKFKDAWENTVVPIKEKFDETQNYINFNGQDFYYNQCGSLGDDHISLFS